MQNTLKQNYAVECNHLLTMAYEICRAIDTQEFADALRAQGYTHLTIQKGAGDYVPQKLVPAGSSTAEHSSGLTVE